MTVADWYAQYQQEGRAWLPRQAAHQRHWLVRFRDATCQQEIYAHCFSRSEILYLYAPDIPVTVATHVDVSLDPAYWGARARADALPNTWSESRPRKTRTKKCLTPANECATLHTARQTHRRVPCPPHK